MFRTPQFCTVAALILCLLTVACADVETKIPVVHENEIAREATTQKEMVVDRMLADESRILDIGYRIMAANVDLCPRKMLTIGLSTWNRYSYVGSDYQRIVNIHYGLDSTLSVRNVIRDMPADLAGIRIGDKIIAINDTALKTGLLAEWDWSQHMRKIRNQDPVKLSVLRNGRVHDFTVTPRTVCGYPIVYDMTNIEPNAYADGTHVIYNRGLLQFNRNDGEIATILGHEIAHNVMHHIEKGKINSELAGLGGLAIDVVLALGGADSGGFFSDTGEYLGHAIYSQSYEAEADYVGLYFMYRAGFDITDSPNLWRRMAAEINPGSIESVGILYSQTHPVTPARFVALTKTQNQIWQKAADNNPILPDMKDATLSFTDRRPSAGDHEHAREIEEELREE